VGEVDDLDTRLQKSVQTLRAWRWMSAITSDPQEVVTLLTAEARALIDLGRQHPDRAKDIGKLIVGYHKLIMRMKNAAKAHCPPNENAAA